MSQAVTCAECAFFVEAVQGLRGPYWHGRERTGLRRSYRAGQVPARNGAVIVSRDFFRLLRDGNCARWLDHLSDYEDDERRDHVRQLPRWFHRLLADVDFTKRVGRDAASHVAASVLGVSVRSVYPRS